MHVIVLYSWLNLKSGDNLLDMAVNERRVLQSALRRYSSQVWSGESNVCELNSVT
jgi:hypothetical protein